MYGRRTSADHVLKGCPHQTTPPVTGEGDLLTHNALLLCPWASCYLSEVDTESMTTRAFLQRSKRPRGMSLTTTLFAYKHCELMSSSGTLLAQRQTAFPQKDNDATPRTHQIIRRRGIAAELASLVCRRSLDLLYIDV